jgi:hypothetical protein
MNDRREPSVILFFIDGLGIGRADENNPLAMVGGIAPLAHFIDRETVVPFEGIMVPTDPRLGVEGRPQSASGQTTILTGINAPAAIGYHKQGFPNAKLREIINEHSIFLQLKRLGIGPNAFANTYTPQFFEKPPRWRSATTVAVEAAGMSFMRLADLAGGFSLFHDFTNGAIREMGFDLPLVTPAEAADRLVRFSERHRFVLYEYFITDKIGHDQNMELARQYLPPLAEFIRAAVSRMDHGKTTFILTSDHGNIEVLSVLNHTLNDVPTIVWGREKEKTAARIRDLSDITPAIIELLKK